MNRVALAILAVVLCGSAVAADGVTTLTHNPFSRPQLVRAATTKSAIESAASPGIAELRATLVAGKRSLANVGGRLLAVGEQTDGYRLVRVGEGFAEFAKDEQTVTVTIDATHDSEGKGR